MAQALVGSGGFLLAVLWFDLMFDVQALGQPEGTLAPEILVSISAYYHRVTTTAAPMGNLVSATMLFTLAGTALQLRAKAIPAGIRWAALGAVLLPVATAVGYVVPAAVQLGLAQDPALVQSALARGILRGHLVCFASIALFIGLQIHAVGRLRGDRRRNGA
jgi:hypothetical protein